MRTNKVNLKGKSLRRYVVNEIRKGTITRQDMIDAGMSRGFIARLRNKEDESVGHTADTIQKCYELITKERLQF